MNIQDHEIPDGFPEKTFFSSGLKSKTLVLILQDVRNGGGAAGKLGIYLGHYAYSVELYVKQRAIGIAGDKRFGCYSEHPVSVLPQIKAAGARHMKEIFDEWRASGGEPGTDESIDFLFSFDHWRYHENPLIELPDGEYIWGCECWWTPVESVEQLEAESFKRQLKHVEKLKATFLHLMQKIAGDDNDCG